ncbi:putative zinc-binding metallopeptidase [Dysgonomonas sp. Marseille-P4677]|uniref:zinc-binding metallopeptidase n=1 Tax=Dysgonomonas sp. Marseille-P4677 TaxID=2364790 RepID=UPI001911F205|nr:putative zinc-binding metallopeptidase [Dysgonomonas sp. Marseille-P4677]MBK5721702.1 putative zinc-binding metallopeptidase [Dysgonomonas sp. Marseille-P4677]
MKNIYYYIISLVLFAFAFASCDDKVDEENSIFVDSKYEKNKFDLWLENNYSPYNIQLKYRLEDIESDFLYDVTPASYETSIAMAKFIQHLWLGVYDEVVNADFTKMNIPKVIHFVGSPAWQSSTTVVLGTAEGGRKITLFDLDRIDLEKLDSDMFVDRYFHTMHHEFAHILHQKKHFSKEFPKISDDSYVGNAFQDEYTEELAHSLGFVTRYARTNYNEDFVEIFSIYITYTEAKWNALLESITAASAKHGTQGVERLNNKLKIVKSYMKEMWKIDMDETRAVFHRRLNEIDMLDLTIK